LQHRSTASPACYDPTLPSSSQPSDPILASQQYEFADLLESLAFTAAGHYQAVALHQRIPLKALKKVAFLGGGTEMRGISSSMFHKANDDNLLAQKTNHYLIVKPL
jgi:hypothetical protein